MISNENYILNSHQEEFHQDSRPHQVFLTAEFKNEEMRKRLLAFSEESPNVCLLYRERLSNIFGINKKQRYTFDMAFRNKKTDHTEETLMNLIRNGKWYFSFKDAQLADEFVEEGLDVLDEFLQKADKKLKLRNEN